MLLLLVGLALFVGGHLLVAFHGLQKRLAAMLGAMGFKLLVTALSLAGIVAIVFGYPEAKADLGVVYTPPVWLSHIALLLMWIAFVLFVSSKIPGKIAKATKHPMLASAKVWAFAHLLANGAIADVVLFGGILAWAVLARIMAKKRERAGVLTPSAGGPVRHDMAAIVVATGLYVAFIFWLHAWLFGVAPISV